MRSMGYSISCGHVLVIMVELLRDGLLDRGGIEEIFMDFDGYTAAEVLDMSENLFSAPARDFLDERSARILAQGIKRWFAKHPMTEKNSSPLQVVMQFFLDSMWRCRKEENFAVVGHGR